MSSIKFRRAGRRKRILSSFIIISSTRADTLRLGSNQSSLSTKCGRRSSHYADKGSFIMSKQIFLTRQTPTYWRVTINHPPLNIFGPDLIPQLNEAITAIETDEQVKVVVFDSAVAGFFLTHYDFLAKIEDTTSLPPGPTGL